MSNEKKTLADVQPGGRVRLGDVPFVWSDRAKTDALEAGQYAFTEADGKDLGYTACIEACVDAICSVLALREHRAALSAQPSTGGQGATSQAVSRMVSTAPERIFLQIGDGDYSNEPFPHPIGEEITWCTDSIVESEVAYVRADLATRQPVGISADWVLGYLTSDAPEESREAIRNAFAEHAALSGARQPVGEPIGYFDPDVLAHMAEGLIDPVGVLRRKPNGTSNVPVWLGPPAQAVDLGEMPDGWRLSKKATCYQLSHGNDIIGNLVGPDAEENAAIIARVLDSKAVDNG
ncbi:hypothetical protein ACODUN_00235 [Stenotrophomonas riyadhensis]